jgi:hypothetical protein
MLAGITVAMLAGSPALGAGPERYEDAIGDSVGDAPDIVAITVSAPDDEPTMRFDVELAPGRLFGTDGETWSDVIFIGMAGNDRTDGRGLLDDGVYITGTHGITLDLQCDTGAMLLTPESLYWYVVDVDTSDDTLSFTLDRKLIDAPPDVYFQVQVGVERDLTGSNESEGEVEGDVYPELGQPPAHYRAGVLVS